MLNIITVHAYIHFSIPHTLTIFHTLTISLKLIISLTLYQRLNGIPKVQLAALRAYDVTITNHDLTITNHDVTITNHDVTRYTKGATVYQRLLGRSRVPGITVSVL